ncbi:MAG: glycosyltransferase 61 family protein [Cyanobacteriota bacterium]
MQFVTLFLILKTWKDMDPSSTLLFSHPRLAVICEDWQRGDYAQVAIHLQQQMEQGSNVPELYWCLGSAQRLLGQELEAQLTWQEGLALLMEAGTAESQAIQKLVKGLQELAENLWETGHWPQAATLYRQCLELVDAVEDLEAQDPEAWKPSFPKALAAHRIGLTQARSRLWLSAITWFEQACQWDPTAAESFLQAGLALIKLGYLRDALLPLERATQLRPDWAEPWVQLGLVWLDLGDPQQALHFFQAAEARDATAQGLHSYWVEAWVQLDCPEAALHQFRRAVAVEKERLRACGISTEGQNPLDFGLLMEREVNGTKATGSADFWQAMYASWRQRLASSSTAAPPTASASIPPAGTAPQNRLPLSDCWPVPTRGYLTTQQWHQITGEGSYQPLDSAGSMSLKSPPSEDPNLLQKLRSQRIPLPETFVAQIPQGSVHVGHYPRHLYASFGSAVLTRQGELLADLSLCLPPPEFLDQNYWPDHLQHHPILGLPHLPPPICWDGPVALLPLGAVNYFHWMVDILPALDNLRRAGILNQPIPILIHGYQGKPFQQQTLDILGIPSERILRFEQLGGSHVQAQTLIVPSTAGPVGCLTPRGLQLLQQWIQPSLSQLYPRRLYISRRSARWRRVINEAEVLAALHPWGFVSVQLETLSLPEQIALMQGAEAVIGIHGAGLSNLAFCRPHTLVVEILPSNTLLPYFWMIAQVAGLRYFPLVAPVCDPALVALLATPALDREDAWVPIPNLLAVLEQAGLDP